MQCAIPRQMHCGLFARRVVSRKGSSDARVAYAGPTAHAPAVEFVPTVTLVNRVRPKHDSGHPGRKLACEAGAERYLIERVESTALVELFI